MYNSSTNYIIIITNNLLYTILSITIGRYVWLILNIHFELVISFCTYLNVKSNRFHEGNIIWKSRISRKNKINCLFNNSRILFYNTIYTFMIIIFDDLNFVIVKFKPYALISLADIIKSYLYSVIIMD